MRRPKCSPSTRPTFRFDTFGDEAFWGGQLQMHLGIAGAANGGAGPGVTPMQALALGLKVDMDALPAAVVTGIQNSTISSTDPATTIALLKLNAVVGVTGVFDSSGTLTSQRQVAGARVLPARDRGAAATDRELRRGHAARGKLAFEEYHCTGCHTAGITSEPGWNMHTPAEMGEDAFQANRSPDGMYRTAPLNGLWTHTKGGFYHDGRFATLAAVLAHYASNGIGNGGTPFSYDGTDEADLEQYLMSL